MAQPRLSNEIFLAILSLIPSSDHATLLSCQLTSRAFREFSTPVLYRHLNISWTANRGLPLLDTLSENTSLVILITSVKVDFPSFDDLAEVKRRQDETIAAMWEAEQREWPARIDRMDPEDQDDEHGWKTHWREQFYDDIDERDRDLRWEAESEAWTDLVRDGNAQWLDPPLPKYEETQQHEGRCAGGERLKELITSLPNLRRLDFTTFESYGIPPLPRLTFLSIESRDQFSPSLLPDTPNIEELVINGTFRRPSESATTLRFPKLHIVRIHLASAVYIRLLLPELLELLKTTLKTLEVTVKFTSTNGQPGVAELLAPSLNTIPRLENLCLPRCRFQTTMIERIDQSPTFMSYLAGSSVRDVSLAFLPSPLLFASLPATIERVKLSERVAENELISSIDSLLLEKARLPHLAFVEMTGGAAEEREDVMKERVEHGRVLGVAIVLR